MCLPSALMHMHCQDNFSLRVRLKPASPAPEAAESSGGQLASMTLDRFELAVQIMPRKSETRAYQMSLHTIMPEFQVPVMCIAVLHGIAMAQGCDTCIPARTCAHCKLTVPSARLHYLQNQLIGGTLLTPSFPASPLVRCTFRYQTHYRST